MNDFIGLISDNSGDFRMWMS